MQARKPALQSLTVLEAAFVLETEFIQLTESSYGPVARLKHLHWLRTGRVKACPLTFKEMISDHFFACTTKMSELDRCKPVPFSSTQSRANKPGIRRPTSSRRFDYLIVKEQRTKNALQRPTSLFGSKTLSPNQRKERNDNAEFHLVKRVFTPSKEVANTR